MILATIFIFIAMLLVLVLVHEAGHLLAAKKAGCNVEEFGFGFPPRLFSRTWKGTRYSFNLIPLGGFVKIEGEDMGEANPSPMSFASKSAGWRIFILSAGVLMNMLLAVVLLGIQSGIGAPTLVTPENAATLTDHKTYILDVAPNSPADQAGLKEFDRIVELNGVQNPTIETVQSATSEHAGESVPVLVDRAGQKIEVSLLARQNPPEGEGSFGVSLASTGLEKVSWWQAPIAGITRTGEVTVAIFSQFGQLAQQFIQGNGNSDTLTGPIGIAVYTNEATQLGLPYLLEFMALISINLAIINILPIPALDGGRILFVVLEKIIGRSRLNKVESKAHVVGFALLIGLMILITVKDVQKYF